MLCIHNIKLILRKIFIGPLEKFQIENYKKVEKGLHLAKTATNLILSENIHKFDLSKCCFYGSP